MIINTINAHPRAWRCQDHVLASSLDSDHVILALIGAPDLFSTNSRLVPGEDQNDPLRQSSPPEGCLRDVGSCRDEDVTLACRLEGSIFHTPSVERAYHEIISKPSFFSDYQQLLVFKDKYSIILIALLVATCACCLVINKLLTSYARAEQLSDHHHFLLIDYTKLWLSFLNKLDWMIIIIFFFVRQNQLRGRHMTRSDSGTSSSWRDHGPHNSCWLHRRQSRAHHSPRNSTVRSSRLS